jgi:hypothetical protein
VVRREERERVHEMTPALVPVAPPLVQPAMMLIPPSESPVLKMMAPEEERELDVEERHAAGQIASAGAAGVPRPPPGSRGPRVQRTSLPELFRGMATREQRDGGLLVDDEVQTLATGQLRKSDFLRELRAEVTSAADRELRRVGRTAADCPYLQQVLDRYDRRTAAEVERSVRRYAPESRSAREARQYIPAVADRVARGVRRWAETGRMPDVPGEDLLSLGTAGGWVGAVAGIEGLQGPEPGGVGGGSGGSGGSSNGSGGGGSTGGGAGGSSTPRRKAIGPSPGRVDGDALVAQLGPGRPLDGTTRTRMEAGFGHSFAAVRIHADDTAADLNRDLSARAFTVGAHVALGAGAPAPGTIEGDELLAHELAHVMQQGTAAPRGDIPVGEAGDEHEQDADRAAEAVITNLHAPAPVKRRVTPRRARGGVRLQRCGASYRPRSPADLERTIPLIRTIRDTYGVTLTEESANWSLEEVAAIHEALGVVTQQVRAEIGPGVVFIRVASTEVTSGGLTGQAVTETGAVREGGVPTRVKRVRVGNDFSSLPSSGMVRVVVHELGHLIESARAHDTRVEVMHTADAIEPARQATSSTHPPFAAAWNATAGPGGTTSRYTGPEGRTFSAFFTAIDGAVQAYIALRSTANDPVIANVMRDQPTRDAALTAALADRDREWAALQTNSPGHRAIADFRSVIDLMDAAVRDLRAYLGARMANERAASAHRAVVTGTDPNELSNRLVAFQRIVDANDYGPLRWPDGPSDPYESYTGRVLRRDGRAAFIREMFAEAFSMWRTERAALQAQAPELVRFFDGGGHLR